MLYRAGSLLLVLLVLGCLQSYTQAQHANGPGECCFGYFTRPIPKKDITGYEETRPDCTQPGIIFTIVDKRRMCVDPKAKWVQRHIKTLTGNTTDSPALT
ncbi:C-C motif chemokine 18-like [Trichomycterus rosablanca]|uniref:C-C motif chemokine 18-like n=1 Tax=Trichomycterus rosablanca TaxID=2290929 RepID=UPI002F356AE0